MSGAERPEQKILITGATGFLGQALVSRALADGYAVRALCRSAAARELLPDAVEMAQGDLQDASSLHRAMEGCDAVIHAAGLVSTWRRDPADFHKVNVEGTQCVLRAARERGITRVLYTSSFFALGPTTERPANEEWQETGSGLPTAYARSKAEADQWVREWNRTGNGVILLYPVLIYGPGRRTSDHPITAMIHHGLRRRRHLMIPGAGTYRWTFAYVDDVAKGHLLALEKAQPGSRYILGGEDASSVELLELLESLTRIPRRKRKIPMGMRRAFAFMEEWRTRFSANGHPRITREDLDVVKHHWRYSSQKAITELGYLRTPMKVGWIKTLESLGFSFLEDYHTTL